VRYSQIFEKDASLVDAEIVVARLAVLRSNLRRLQEIIGHGREAFVLNEDLHLKAERCLQLALQAMLDIGTHVIASEGLERPSGYEGVVPELGKAGYLSGQLVERLQGAAGMRNILVHDYVRLDYERLLDTVSEGIPDPESFAKEIGALLDD